MRKHCRKSHPEWLREVDLDKTNHNCRWAAYCTREAITEGHDPRPTRIGSKRAREIMAQGGALPPLASGLTGVPKAPDSSFGGAVSTLEASFGAGYAPRPEQKVPRMPAHGVAMDGKSALVPLRPFPNAMERTSSSENMMPPVRIGSRLSLRLILSSPRGVRASVRHRRR